MNNSIQSFTERALLNQTALDWLYPPNCATLRVQPSDSILTTLAQSNINNYQPNQSYWHWGTKPIRAVGRTLYTELVLMTVSPLGTAWFGFKTLKHLSKYAIAAYQKNESLKKEEWERTKQYAKPFFNDFTNFICGIFTSMGMALGTTFLLLAISHKAQSVLLRGLAFSAISYCASAYLLGAFDPASVIPLLIADEKMKTGMYLSLAMRNELGLVRSDGGLLPFSAKDKIEFKQESIGLSSSYNFHGQTHKALGMMIAVEELNLVDMVRMANTWLTASRLPTIPYSYPFKGDAVAERVEKAVTRLLQQAPSASSTGDIAQGKTLVGRLKAQNHRIETLRNFHYSIKKLAIEESRFLSFLMALGGVNRNITVRIPDSYVGKAIYKNHFERST